MDIIITGRNIDLDDDIKDYIHKRLDKLEKLYSRIYECKVILEEEKIRKNVEVILCLKRNKIVAKESSTDIYTSVDNAASNVTRQLRKLRGKISTKRRRAMIKRIMKPVSRFRG